MKHMEEKHSCPHCGKETHRQPYVMSRRSDEHVLDLRVALWMVVLVLVLVIVTN